MIHSYSSPFNVGHAGAKDVFNDPVVVEEKIDGSQFSFSVAEDGETLLCRSKGAQIHVDAPEGMFAKGVETARSLLHDLVPGWVYRGEYLQKPKHNSLAYNRIPHGNIILFDIDRGDQDYLSPDEKRTEAGRLGLEVVPVLFEGIVTSLEQFQSFLPAVSVLGGQPAEGIVAKNYRQYAADKKVLMVKYVTDHFREVHKAEWKKTAPTPKDVIEEIVRTHKTPARWEKAVQHLRDAGTLTDSPKDIGALLKETVVDIEKECTDEMKETLWRFAWPHIKRGVVAGLPEWYKERLMQNLFEKDVEAFVAAP